MPAIHSSFNGKIVREYIKHVDLSPGTHGYKCVVMTHVPDVLADLLSRRIIEQKLHDVFDIRMRPANSAWQCATFNPVFKFASENTMRTLIRLLKDLRLPIKWKEGFHGYLIDPEGLILRSWKLGVKPVCTKADKPDDDKPKQLALTT